MPDQLTINEELGIIEVYSSGEITVEEAEQTVKKSLRIFKERNIDKVLVDATSLTKLPGTVEIFQFLSSSPPELTQALVISKDSFSEDLLSFGENVAVNRGKNVKLFFDREEALSWLKSLDSE